MPAAPSDRIFKVEAEGIKELHRDLRKAGASADDFSRVNKEVADEIAVGGRREVPVRSGRLRSTIRGESTTRVGIVAAGNNGVPYAGPIHFGDPFRGAGKGLTASQLIEQLGSKGSGVISDKALRRLAARNRGKFRAERDTRTGRFVKGSKGTFVGAQKGGPIPPNPFLYRALDQRIDMVWAAYGKRAEDIAKIVDPGTAG